MTPTAAGLAAIATDPNLSATNFGIFKQYVPVAASQAASDNPSAPCNVGVNAIGYSAAPAVGTCTGGAIPIGPVTVAAPAWQNFENFVQSIDYNVSSRDQIRGRYIYNKVDNVDQAANLSAFYTVEPFRFHLFTLGEYHTFTPSVINEFRVGFNRYFNNLPAGDFRSRDWIRFPT